MVTKTMLYISKTLVPPKPSLIVAQIVATTEDGLIGVGDKLPWARVKEDMKFFKAKTQKHIVIMGYNTILSLPNKFHDRFVVGVSRKTIDLNNEEHLKFNYRCDNIISLAGQHGSFRYIKDLIGDKEYGEEYIYTLDPNIVYVAGGGMLYASSLLETDVVFRNVIKCPLLELEGEKVYYPLERLKQHFILIASEEVEIENGTMVKEIWVKPR